MGIWLKPLGNVVEHPNQSQSNPVITADEPPCTFITLYDTPPSSELCPTAKGESPLPEPQQEADGGQGGCGQGPQGAVGSPACKSFLVHTEFISGSFYFLFWSDGITTQTIIGWWSCENALYFQ